jgi:hypothetical protein
MKRALKSERNLKREIAAAAAATSCFLAVLLAAGAAEWLALGRF